MIFVLSIDCFYIMAMMILGVVFPYYKNSNAGSFFVHYCILYFDLQRSKILFVIVYYDILTTAINLS